VAWMKKVNPFANIGLKVGREKVACQVVDDGRVKLRFGKHDVGIVFVPLMAGLGSKLWAANAQARIS
jgi:hypothetical protein